jgi:hypothetical protein
VLESSDGNRPALDTAVGNLAAEHKTGQGLGCPGPVVLSDLGGRLQKPFGWLTLVVAGVTSLAGAQYVRAGAKVRPVDSGVLRQIDSARHETWRWEGVVGRGPTQSSRSERRMENVVYRRWVLSLWLRRATRARQRAQHPPHLRDWLCIHRYEGGWRDDTGNGYYGGLQMDMGFQRTYAPWLLRKKGTANHWTALEQIWVAERARESGRGFYPWPNTARACGLI